MTIRGLFKTLASHNGLMKSFGYKQHVIRVQADGLVFEGDSINDFINDVTGKGHSWELAYKLLDLEVKTGKHPITLSVPMYTSVSVSLEKKDKIQQ